MVTPFEDLIDMACISIWISTPWFGALSLLSHRMLSIFHSMGKYSEARLINRLAPVFYSFLTLLTSSSESVEEWDSDVMIFRVTKRILDRFGEPLLSIEGWMNFVDRIRSRMDERLLSHLVNTGVLLSVSEQI